MDWLKDKKNQPIVAGVLAVVILGAAVGVFMMKGPSAPAETGAATQTAQAPAGPTAGPAGGPTPAPSAGAPAPAPGGPAASPAPAAPAGPAPAGTAPGPAQPSALGAKPGAKPDPVGASPMEAWRTDPFLPIGYRPPPKHKYVPKAPIADLPFDNFSVLPPDEAKLGPPDMAQPARRMAGLFLSDRIFAIIETNGTSQVVQPGDMLDDRLAVVDRIEKDRVVLKTTDPRPRYVVITMASSAKADTSANANTNINPLDPAAGGVPPSRMPGPYAGARRFRGRPGG